MAGATVVARVDEPGRYSDGAPRQEITILSRFNELLPFNCSDCPKTVTIDIGSTSHSGLIRCTISSVFWIPGYVDDHSTRLSDALRRAGFKRGHLELVVEPDRVTVSRQLSVHGEA